MQQVYMAWEDEVAHGITKIKNLKGQRGDLKAKIRKLANFWEEINTDKIIFFGMIIDLESQVSINRQCFHSKEFH